MTGGGDKRFAWRYANLEAPLRNPLESTSQRQLFAGGDAQERMMRALSYLEKCLNQSRSRCPPL